MIKRTCIVMDVLLAAAVGMWGFLDASPLLILQVDVAHGVVHLLAGVAAVAGPSASQALARFSDWATYTPH